MQSHPCYLSLRLFLYTFSRSYTDSWIYLQVNSRSGTRDCGVVDGVVDGGGGGVSGKHQVKFAEIMRFHFLGETINRMFTSQPNH